MSYCFLGQAFLTPNQVNSLKYRLPSQNLPYVTLITHEIICCTTLFPAICKLQYKFHYRNIFVLFINICLGPNTVCDCGCSINICLIEWKCEAPSSVDEIILSYIFPSFPNILRNTLYIAFITKRIKTFYIILRNWMLHSN